MVLAWWRNRSPRYSHNQVLRIMMAIRLQRHTANPKRTKTSLKARKFPPQTQIVRLLCQVIHIQFSLPLEAKSITEINLGHLALKMDQIKTAGLKWGPEINWYNSQALFRIIYLRIKLKKLLIRMLDQIRGWILEKTKVYLGRLHLKTKTNKPPTRW